MMQMMKHIADPIRPMIVSKLGIKIASIVITTIKVVLIKLLTNRRVEPENIDDWDVPR